MSEIAGRRISVLDPIGAAIQRVKYVLFMPFVLEKWLVIGFGAWLAGFAEAKNWSFNFPRWDAGSGERIKTDMGELAQYLPIIIVAVVAVIIIGVAIHICILWLGSRGRFMFLHCVAGNVAQVKVPWRRYKVQGNSLFLFRLAVGFVTLFFFGLMIAAGIILGLVWYRSTGLVAIIIVAAVAIPVLIFLSLVFALVEKFTKDFVVPLMAIRNCTCLAAWREFMGLLGANKGRFALYILFQAAIRMAVGMIVAPVVLLAVCCCCCAIVLFMIPYVGTVMLLPWHVFVRSYSVLYLAQYGPAYNAIAPEQPEVQGRSFTPPPGPYSPPVQGL